MKKTRIIPICLFSTVILIILYLFFHNAYFHHNIKSFHQEIKETPEGKEYLALMREEIKRRDVPITFYGKIIDQNERPVSGANVEIQIPHFSSQGEYFEDVKTINVKSNPKGAFTVQNQKGSALYIETINKNGFEYIRDTNPNDSFTYWADLPERIFTPDKTNPVIFRLRKKEAPTYLIEWFNYARAIFYANATGEVWHLDLVWPDFRPAHDTNMNVGYGFQPMYTDATVLVQSNQDHTAYNICFTAPDTTGGIMETNVLMYVAPESGYRTNLVYSLPIVKNDRYDTNTFFYIKSRGGKVYARMSASFTAYGDDDGCVMVDFHSWANPYGERNLEAEPRLKYDTQQRLHDEAQAALLAGKLPPQPDIPKLLKTEGEYKE